VSEEVQRQINEAGATWSLEGKVLEYFIIWKYEKNFLFLIEARLSLLIDI
jgi:hypothetical protein